jgi:hypothetical protein
VQVAGPCENDKGFLVSVKGAEFPKLVKLLASLFREVDVTPACVVGESLKGESLKSL